MKRPVTMYAESTPNPATMKFVADVMLVIDGNTAEYVNQQEAKGSSSLAEALFNFPFVSGVFIASNFIAISKTDALQWEYVSEELKAFVLDWLQNNEVIIENVPEEREVEVTQEGNKETISSAPQIVTDADKKIFELLEEFVRPAVESDGGAIDFQSFDEITGTVTVVLKGACSGCPSSTATLKGGIESLLKTHMPEVQEVVALEG
jgi:NFU1 iron-sulfur cluster scaffold homolog, mitochondrial